MFITVLISVHLYVKFNRHRLSGSKIGQCKSALRIVSGIGDAVYFHTAGSKRRAHGDWVGKYQVAL